MDKQIELSNYQKYSSMLGSSSIITAGNIAGLSAGLLPRASLFAQYTHQASAMSASQNMQMMRMMGQIPTLPDPLMQQQFELSAYNQFREQALKALKQQEASVLNEKEKAIQLELNELEHDLNIKRKRLEKYNELKASRVEDFAPKFGL